MIHSARLMGIDPGLRFTGWGVIDVTGNRLRHVADGVIATDSSESVPFRLKTLHDALVMLFEQHRPDEAAVEETYVNRNGTATLKLGYARGVALLAPALVGIPVSEYGAKSVKLSVVGTGGASKDQVEGMVRRLLPGATLRRADAADALAVAICHAHHRASRLRVLSGTVTTLLGCRAPGAAESVRVSIIALAARDHRPGRGRGYGCARAFGGRHALDAPRMGAWEWPPRGAGGDGRPPRSPMGVAGIPGPAARPGLSTPGQGLGPQRP